MRVSIGIAIVLFNILGFVAGDLSNPPPLNFNATSDTDSPERAALILSSSDKVHLQAGPPPPPAQPPDQASIELWNACVCKGTKLLNGMRGSQSDAGKFYEPQRDTAQSSFLEKGDLEKWGWEESDNIPDFVFKLDYSWGLAGVLQNIGVSDKVRDEGGDNDVLKFDHWVDGSPIKVEQQTYKIGEKMYPMTGAFFVFSVNAKDGVIITLNRHSPKSKANERTPKIPDDQLPQLNQFSDVGWLAYNDMIKKRKVDKPLLKYFISASVNNEKTRAIVDQAMAEVNGQLAAYPGTTFRPDSAGYKAILGTPNGQGFGYFLMTHKDQLNNLFFSEIHAFKCDDDYLCLLFKVAPVPGPKAPGEQDPELIRRNPESNSTFSEGEGKPILRVNRVHEENSSREYLPPTPQRLNAGTNGSIVHIEGEIPPPEALEPPASDFAWATARNKGCSLVDAMHGSDWEAGQLFNPPRESAESPWDDPYAFDIWYWHTYERKTGTTVDFYSGHNYPNHGWGIGHVLTSLGLSDKIKAQGGRMTVEFLTHGDNKLDADEQNGQPFDEQTYKVGDRTYRATGAEVSFALNTEEGVIMGLDRTSPQHAAQERDPPVPADNLPALQAFSDIAYLTWLESSTPQDTPPRNLRYFMSLTITNKKTQAVIHRALNNAYTALGPWPGFTFGRETPEFRALLGSPNGAGFAFLLIQHEEQLGNMFISKVQVFHGDTYHKAPCLVFHVEREEATPVPSSSSSAALARRMGGVGGGGGRGRGRRVRARL